MEHEELLSAVEAIIFAAGEPIEASRIGLVLGEETEKIISCARELADAYEESKSGIRLVRMNERLQLCSAPEFATYVQRALEQRKPPRLSQSALEVLAVTAYFQPVTRAYIDQVRGVDSSYTVSSLMERGLIEPAGKLDVPGRPTLLRTTDVFLRTMSVSSLEELPKLPDMSGGDGVMELQRKIEQLQNAENGGEQLSLSEIQSSGE